MVRVHGKDYPTISDVKEKFGVSVKTIREWMTKEIIPRPPQIAQGTKLMDYFPPEYVENAIKKVKEYRERKVRRTS